MAAITRRLVYEIMLILGLAQVICSQNILSSLFSKEHNMFNFSNKKGRVYNVGGPLNWSPHVNYNLWVVGKTFYPGDVLEFKYTEGLNVKRVPTKDFEDCKGDNAIFADQSGRTSFTLNSTGDYCFICSVFDYCHTGMKLKVSVK